MKLNIKKGAEEGTRSTRWRLSTQWRLAVCSCLMIFSGSVSILAFFSLGIMPVMFNILAILALLVALLVIGEDEFKLSGSSVLGIIIIFLTLLLIAFASFKSNYKNHGFGQQETQVESEILDTSGGGELREIENSSNYILTKDGKIYIVHVIRDDKNGEDTFVFTETNTLPE